MKNKESKKSLIKNNNCTYSNFHVKDGYVYACRSNDIKFSWNSIIETAKKIKMLFF